MTPERWEQIEDLFHRAMECDADERMAVLEAADAELRPEVELLLSSYEGAGARLQAAVAGGAPAAEEDRNPETVSGTVVESTGPPNTMVGAYRLLQMIGEGGMGEVWLAEQREPVRRRVAVKLIRAGMNTREVIARFDSERRVLALMDHPAIATVFEAGSTTQGTPFFAMEYVAGIPITSYCDDHRLDIRGRLELFQRVCEGVQHAHQKAIIHRDLKPSNILVTELDGRPAPKIIDFGVAKALTQKLSPDTLFTRVGAMIGTPEYMSPEQALSSGEDIDTRTDVYSLGIVLYQLLAGGPPLDCREISLEEFLRRLREEDPPKPGTRIRTEAPATAEELARKRRTEPRALAKLMRGDLDSITLKALEKERSRRYGSPVELAADIGRYLKNEPVLAMPPSAAYRARKFARRYRAGLVTAAAFLLVLIMAASISVRQSIRATSEAAVARAVNDFLLNDLLAQAGASTQAGPSTSPDPHLEVRTALDRAAARIPGKFEKQPLVEASVRQTIGNTYEDLGLYREAEAHYQRALALRSRILGETSPATWESMDRLGQLYREEDKYAEAEPLRKRLLEIRKRVLGDFDPDTIDAMNNLALIYQSQRKLSSAEPLYLQALDGLRRLKRPENRQSLTIKANLAQLYSDQGKYAQAEQLCNEVVQAAPRMFGPEHPTTLVVMNNLAQIYFNEGKWAQAAQLHEKVAAIDSRVLGPEHPSTLMDYGNLASVYRLEGRYSAAEALLNRVLEVQRRVLGTDRPTTLTTMTILGGLKWSEGNYVDAEQLFTRALDGQRRLLGNEDPRTVGTLVWLGRVRLAQHQFQQAETNFREALTTYQRTNFAGWQRYHSENLLGASLAGERKYDQAEPLLIAGYEGMIERREKISVPSQHDLQSAGERIVRLYEDWPKPDKAAVWRTKVTLSPPTP